MSGPISTHDYCSGRFCGCFAPHRPRRRLVTTQLAKHYVRRTRLPTRRHHFRLELRPAQLAAATEYIFATRPSQLSLPCITYKICLGLPQPAVEIQGHHVAHSSGARMPPGHQCGPSRPHPAIELHEQNAHAACQLWHIATFMLSRNHGLAGARLIMLNATRSEESNCSGLPRQHAGCDYVFRRVLDRTSRSLSRRVKLSLLARARDASAAPFRVRGTHYVCTGTAIQLGGVTPWRGADEMDLPTNPLAVATPAPASQ